MTALELELCLIGFCVYEILEAAIMNLIKPDKNRIEK